MIAVNAYIIQFVVIYQTVDIVDPVVKLVNYGGVAKVYLSMIVVVTEESYDCAKIVGL